jgi:Ca2+-binding EF-hand superfamily protein
MADNCARLMEQTARAIRIEWRNNDISIPKPATGERYTEAELDQIINIMLHNTDGELTFTFNGDDGNH